jgi:PIN domain nuclease of toxin-antitoxin system
LELTFLLRKHHGNPFNRFLVTKTLAESYTIVFFQAQDNLEEAENRISVEQKRHNDVFQILNA